MKGTQYDINDSASAPADRSTFYSILSNSLSGTAGGEDRPTHFYARATAIHHTAERTSDIAFGHRVSLWMVESERATGEWKEIVLRLTAPIPWLHFSERYWIDKCSVVDPSARCVRFLRAQWMFSPRSVGVLGYGGSEIDVVLDHRS